MLVNEQPAEARVATPAYNRNSVTSLTNRFMHHVPKGDQASRYEKIQAILLDAACRCVELTPCSAEQTRAVNALDEAMMLFNASIARNE
jgi:hypothetical protein